MAIVLDPANGVTFNDLSLQGAAASPYVLKNRIINGAMVIDQRNAGASYSAINLGYSLDRWQVVSYSGGAVTGKFTVQQNAGSVTPPAGFKNYLGVTSSAATTISANTIYGIAQPIEGFNVADLGFGASGASTVTLSFWVRSSLTGTFGGALTNSNADRCYPFTYTISSANTWEQKSITVTGDTTGTWLTTNGIGIYIVFGLGGGSSWSATAGSWTSSLAYTATGATNFVSTNGATWYITGVQLEVGSTATPFERRLYGQEMANCQRYYYREVSAGSGYLLGIAANAYNTTLANIQGRFPVTMRTNPTAIEQTGTAANYSVLFGTTTTTCSAVPTFNFATNDSWSAVFTVASGLTGGQSGLGRGASGAYLGFSAEL